VVRNVVSVGFCLKKVTDIAAWVSQPQEREVTAACIFMASPPKARLLRLKQIAVFTILVPIKLWTCDPQPIALIRSNPVLSAVHLPLDGIALLKVSRSRNLLLFVTNLYKICKQSKFGRLKGYGRQDEKLAACLPLWPAF